MKEAVLWRKFKDKIVECLTCCWYCKIPPQQVGVCRTRLNKNGKLYSLVYGKAIGLHLDPVEKKPLFHFLPGAKILSFGTVGCNFGCLFCQNWQMSNQVKSLKFEVKNLEEILVGFINQISQKITPKEIVQIALAKKADGIAYTYNEPAIFVEFARDTAKIAKSKGLRNIYVSNGFESKEAFEYIKDYLDAINIDLKSFKKEFYLKICRGKIEPVLENIKRFFTSGIETEVTTLVIPGYNDSQEELTAIAKFLASISLELPWHISAFYPAYKMLTVPPTSHQKLIEGWEIGRKVGLKYVYLGNVLDWRRESTYCPKCGSLLIYRFGYQVEVKNLDRVSGRCGRCQEKIYGLWR